MKKCWYVPLVCSFMVLCSVNSLDVNASNKQNNQIQLTQTSHLTKTPELLTYTGHSDETLYFAYLDYDSASLFDKPKILKARNEIIFHESWSSETVTIGLKNRDKEVIKIYPKFYEIFPDDWDMPRFNNCSGETAGR